MGEKKYYIRDSRSYVGNNLVFWAKGSSGYTCHIGDAELYTEEEAQSIHANRKTDVPMLKEEVEAAATLQVDVQLLRKNREDGGEKSIRLFAYEFLALPWVRRVMILDQFDVASDLAEGEAVAACIEAATASGRLDELKKAVNAALDN